MVLKAHSYHALRWWICDVESVREGMWCDIEPIVTMLACLLGL